MVVRGQYRVDSQQVAAAMVNRLGARTAVVNRLGARTAVVRQAVSGRADGHDPMRELTGLRAA